MKSPSVITEIQNNPSLVPYKRDVRRFLDYLHTTSKCSFILHGKQHYDDMPPDDISRKIEYVNRWTDTYRKSILKKFYQLEEWMKENPSDVTMLTLTTYQDGEYSILTKGEKVSIPNSFDLLKRSWKLLRRALKYYIPDIEYVWIMEPHKTGYPHLHVVILDDVSESAQEAIKKLWSKNYKAGSEKHGVNFSVKKSSEAINSIRNYLMKYMAKGFKTTGSKFGRNENWGAGELVFNALAWKHKWRFFGVSRNLCGIMAYSKKTDENFDWNAIEMIDSNGEYHLLRAKDCDTFDKVAALTKRLGLDRESTKHFADIVHRF